MNGILHDPWERFHMGFTAENIAARYGISREEQYQLAALSQQRASQAITNGYFVEQIVPVEIKTRKGLVNFADHEHVRADVTIEQLASMKPAFKREGGTVTAGMLQGSLMGLRRWS